MEGQNSYVKRTQKDYSLSFKLQIVQEIERGKITASEATKQYGIQCRKSVINWLRKYGNFDWENQTPSNMPKTPEQRIMELEAKVKLLEKQKAQLENQNHISDSKAIIFDMMIDLAEKEYNIDIRKNLPPGQSSPLVKKGRKA
ncbi:MULTISPECIES: helix-turn-helix domain-containing protein [Emticicia]|uniref:helix-turn-helix domain-containing protein n=1 Tax=Emticicia TaxID=312278 RepID=UPI00209F4259|nr:MULTISPECIES: helix-turn-helix domain-containing protein [Emticicia]UTA69877.1 transposase [Emticicia sp. 21SJ11W-3]